MSLAMRRARSPRDFHGKCLRKNSGAQGTISAAEADLHIPAKMPSGKNDSRMRIYFSAASQRGLVPKVPICFVELTEGEATCYESAIPAMCMTLTLFFRARAESSKRLGPRGKI